MKWALVIVYLSGFFDSGLRFSSYEACMKDGVRESYMRSCIGRGCKLYDYHPPARDKYHQSVQCFPINE